MKGAREYAGLFKTGQYGRLYIEVGKHARGRTFHIFVLPEGIDISLPGPGGRLVGIPSVEVYGIIGGNPGWTESYGWLHEGKWQADFDSLVKAQKAKALAAQDSNDRAKDDEHKADENRTAALLATYK